MLGCAPVVRVLFRKPKFTGPVIVTPVAPTLTAPLFSVDVPASMAKVVFGAVIERPASAVVLPIRRENVTGAEVLIVSAPGPSSVEPKATTAPAGVAALVADNVVANWNLTGSLKVCAPPPGTPATSSVVTVAPAAATLKTVVPP